MTALRICMITTFYPPFNFGGDGIAVQRLSRALVRAGHDVTVVHDTDAFRSLHHGPRIDMPEEGEDQGVQVIRLRSRLGSLSPLLVQQLGRPVVHARRLRQLLSPGQFDVVNFHNISLIGGPGILSYPTDAVTLYMAHEHWLVCPTHVLWRHRRERCDERQCLRCVLRHHRPPQIWRYTGALRRALARVDAVIAMSEFSRQKHRAFGLEREMEVLPPFLPTERAETSRSKSSPHPRPYFFFAGRLELMKGLDDVLVVFRDFRDADLVVAGEGSQRTRWQDISADLPHVHFVGSLAAERMPAWHRHALATLAPSVGYETFGMVVIEAMQVGTPVIARRVGPFPEILADTGAGELFDTPADLLSALQRIAGDPSHRAKLSTAAVQSSERWSAAAVIPRYLEIVARAAAARRHRGVIDAPRGMA